MNHSVNSEGEKRRGAPRLLIVHLCTEARLPVRLHHDGVPSTDTTVVVKPPTAKTVSPTPPRCEATDPSTEKKNPPPALKKRVFPNAEVQHHHGAAASKKPTAKYVPTYYLPFSVFRHSTPTGAASQLIVDRHGLHVERIIHGLLCRLDAVSRAAVGTRAWHCWGHPWRLFCPRLRVVEARQPRRSRRPAQRRRRFRARPR